MAKTNPYSTGRQANALAFEDERAEPSQRSRRSVAEAREAARGERLRFDQAPVPIEDDERELLRTPRARRRVPVVQQDRRGSRVGRFLLRTRVGWALLSAGLLGIVVVAWLGLRAVRGFLEHDPHFRIASSASIQIVGASELTPADLLQVFGSDLGRNIFFVPLAERQAQLEQVPWVAHAAVMRLLPDQLRIAITERTPIAFVRLGNGVALVDAEGVILHLPAAKLAERHYSFPVVAGIDPKQTPAVRAARMQLYRRFIAELDAPDPANPSGSPAQAGPPISSQLSEVDLSDSEDVRAVVPAQGSDILLHLGDSDFLARFHSYQAHLPEWRREYPHLSAIDLRYDRQVVLKMADGAESEASSVEHGATLAAATPATAPAPAHHPAPSAGAHHSAGHGTAHGWRPV